MTHVIVGKAIDTESWLRLDEPEYCQRPMIDDIIQTDDAVYRVGGGYGYRPMHLYWIDQDAVNDEPQYYICQDCGERKAIQPDYICEECFYADEIAFLKACGEWDEPADLAEYRDYRQTVDAVARENA